MHTGDDYGTVVRLLIEDRERALNLADAVAFLYYPLDVEVDVPELSRIALLLVLGIV